MTTIQKAIECYRITDKQTEYLGPLLDTARRA